MRGQSCTPSPSASASACGAHSSGQDSTCSPPSITLLPRLRYQCASSNARLRESQMHRDPDDLRHRLERRPPVEQVFIPISNLPVRRRRRREAGQRQRRRQHVFAEAGVRIFGIEGIDQQRVARLDCSRACRAIEGAAGGSSQEDSSDVAGALQKSQRVYS